MLLFIACEGAVDAFCQSIGAGLGQQVAFFIGSRDVTKFDEYTRHGGFSQHEESGLMHAFVDTFSGCLELPLDEGGKIDALLHILVLQELEYDVAFRRVRVEPGISLFVIALNEDDGVFFFGHFQIVVGTVEPQCVGFRAPDGASACYRVGMDGNEKVGLGVVGYLCPSVQGYEDVLR